MGVAATRRGDKLISRQLQGDQRRPEFLLMDDLNALPKLPGSGRPWGPMAIQRDSQGFWWALDPKKLFSGFGYYYKSLREAVQSWQVEVTGYDSVTGIWSTRPLPL